MYSFKYILSVRDQTDDSVECKPPHNDYYLLFYII